MDQVEQSEEQLEQDEQKFHKKLFDVCVCDDVHMEVSESLYKYQTWIYLHFIRYCDLFLVDTFVQCSLELSRPAPIILLRILGATRNTNNSEDKRMSHAIIIWCVARSVWESHRESCEY